MQTEDFLTLMNYTTALSAMSSSINRDLVSAGEEVGNYRKNAVDFENLKSLNSVIGDLQGQVLALKQICTRFILEADRFAQNDRLLEPTEAVDLFADFFNTGTATRQELTSTQLSHYLKLVEEHISDNVADAQSSAFDSSGISSYLHRVLNNSNILIEVLQITDELLDKVIKESHAQ